MRAVLTEARASAALSNLGKAAGTLTPAYLDIDLTGSGLESIDVISKYKYIQNVTLDRNALTDLTPLGALNDLRTLSVASNRIDKFLAFKAPRALERVNYNDNCITCFAESDKDAERLAQEFKYLSQVSVRRNSIRSLKYVAALQSLAMLDVSDNELTSMDELASCVRLTSLSLANNRIETIVFPTALPMLTALDLSRNKIREVPPISPTSAPSLQALSLAGNEISSLEAVANLAALKSLTHLDLRGNPVTELPNYRLRIVHHFYCARRAVANNPKSPIVVRDGDAFAAPALGAGAACGLLMLDGIPVSPEELLEAKRLHGSGFSSQLAIQAHFLPRDESTAPSERRNSAELIAAGNVRRPSLEDLGGISLELTQNLESAILKTLKEFLRRLPPDYMQVPAPQTPVHSLAQANPKAAPLAPAERFWQSLSERGDVDNWVPILHALLAPLRSSASPQNGSDGGVLKMAPIALDGMRVQDAGLVVIARLIADAIEVAKSAGSVLSIPTLDLSQASLPAALLYPGHSALDDMMNEIRVKNTLEDRMSSPEDTSLPQLHLASDVESLTLRSRILAARAFASSGLTAGEGVGWRLLAGALLSSVLKAPVAVDLSLTSRISVNLRELNLSHCGLGVDLEASRSSFAGGDKDEALVVNRHPGAPTSALVRASGESILSDAETSSPVDPNLRLDAVSPEQAANETSIVRAKRQLKRRESGHSIHWLARILTFVTSLEVLNLSNNALGLHIWSNPLNDGNHNPRDMPPAIVKACPALNAICGSIRSCRNLRVLDLSANGIDDVGVTAVAAILPAMCHSQLRAEGLGLATLVLDDNCIGEMGGKALARALGAAAAPAGGTLTSLSLATSSPLLTLFQGSQSNHGSILGQPRTAHLPVQRALAAARGLPPVQPVHPRAVEAIADALLVETPTSGSLELDLSGACIDDNAMRSLCALLYADASSASIPVAESLAIPQHETELLERAQRFHAFSDADAAEAGFVNHRMATMNLASKRMSAVFGLPQSRLATIPVDGVKEADDSVNDESPDRSQPSALRISSLKLACCALGPVELARIAKAICPPISATDSTPAPLVMLDLSGNCIFIPGYHKPYEVVPAGEAFLDAAWNSAYARSMDVVTARLISALGARQSRIIRLSGLPAGGPRVQAALPELLLPESGSSAVEALTLGLPADLATISEAVAATCAANLLPVPQIQDSDRLKCHVTSIFSPRPGIKGSSSNETRNLLEDGPEPYTRYINDEFQVDYPAAATYLANGTERESTLGNITSPKGPAPWVESVRVDHVVVCPGYIAHSVQPTEACVWVINRSELCIWKSESVIHQALQLLRRAGINAQATVHLAENGNTPSQVAAAILLTGMSTRSVAPEILKLAFNVDETDNDSVGFGVIRSNFDACLDDMRHFFGAVPTGYELLSGWGRFGDASSIPDPELAAQLAKFVAEYVEPRYDVLGSGLVRKVLHPSALRAAKSNSSLRELCIGGLRPQALESLLRALGAGLSEEEEEQEQEEDGDDADEQVLADDNVEGAADAGTDWSGPEAEPPQVADQASIKANPSTRVHFPSLELLALPGSIWDHVSWAALVRLVRGDAQGEAVVLPSLSTLSLSYSTLPRGFSPFAARMYNHAVATVATLATSPELSVEEASSLAAVDLISKDTNLHTYPYFLALGPEVSRVTQSFAAPRIESFPTLANGDGSVHLGPMELGALLDEAITKRERATIREVWNFVYVPREIVIDDKIVQLAPGQVADSHVGFCGYTDAAAALDAIGSWTPYAMYLLQEEARQQRLYTEDEDHENPSASAFHPRDLIESIDRQQLNKECSDTIHQLLNALTYTLQANSTNPTSSFELDLAHMPIGDGGAWAIGEWLLELQNVDVKPVSLNLAGCDLYQSIAYGVELALSQGLGAEIQRLHLNPAIATMDMSRRVYARGLVSQHLEQALIVAAMKEIKADAHEDASDTDELSSNHRQQGKQGPSSAETEAMAEARVVPGFALLARSLASPHVPMTSLSMRSNLMTPRAARIVASSLRARARVNQPDSDLSGTPLEIDFGGNSLCVDDGSDALKAWVDLVSGAISAGATWVGAPDLLFEPHGVATSVHSRDAGKLNARVRAQRLELLTRLTNSLTAKDGDAPGRIRIHGLDLGVSFAEGLTAEEKSWLPSLLDRMPHVATGKAKVPTLKSLTACSVPLWDSPLPSFEAVLGERVPRSGDAYDRSQPSGASARLANELGTFEVVENNVSARLAVSRVLKV